MDNNSDNEDQYNNNDFITMGDAQYHDDNIAQRGIVDNLLYYENFIELGPKYGMILIKKNLN